MPPTPYDFTPLNQPVTFAEVLQELRQKWYFRNVFARITIALLVVGPILLFSYSLIDFITVSALLIMVLGPLFGVVYTTRHTLPLKRLARANGWLFLQGIPAVERPGVIFNQGHGQRFTAGFGTLSTTNSFLELANFQYVTGSGRSQQIHRYHYICIQLTRCLPHIVLDAKNNNYFGSTDNLPLPFDSDQRLSLEGDFDKYFTLYTPKTYERDALYVITPDIMQLLVDVFGNYDVEIIDNYAYIYRGGHLDLTNASALQHFIMLGDRLKTELGHQTDRYRDAAVEDKTINQVASVGRRLEKNSSAPMALLIILVAAGCIAITSCVVVALFLR